MSQNSKCNTGCTVVGKKMVDTMLPNLVSPADVVAGKRPCKGKKAFNVMWCAKLKGWPAGSMVHTKCGYFFNTMRAYGNPSDADSEWIEFDFEFIFSKLLDSMICDGALSLDGDVKLWSSAEDEINLAMAGETWNFTTLNSEGEEIGVYACAKEDDLIKNPIDKPDAWTAMQTPAQLMCKLLNL